eukprot:2623707-Rhodomonas_salina.2
MPGPPGHAVPVADSDASLRLPVPVTLRLGSCQCQVATVTASDRYQPDDHLPYHGGRPSGRAAVTVTVRPSLAASASHCHRDASGGHSNCHASGGTTANRLSTRRAQRWRLHAT